MEIKKEELFFGNYNSVLTKIKEEVEKTKDVFARNILIQDFNSLAKKKLINTKISKNLSEGNFNTFSINENEEKKKIAEFPCVINGKCIGFLSIISRTVNNNKNIFEEKSEINFLKVLTSFKRFIQKNLKDIKTKKTHTLVLNWGEYFDIYELFQETDSKYYHKNEKKIKDNSYHFAALVSFFSSVFNYEINPNYIFSGAFDEKGQSEKITYLNEKLDKILIERPNVEKIFIPTKNESEILNHALNSKIVLIDSFESLIETVFANDIVNLIYKEKSFYNNIGISRLNSESIGLIEIEFVKYDHTKTIVLQKERKKMKVIFLRFDGEKNYNEFPFNENVIEDHIFLNYEVIIFEGKIPAFYLSNFISYLHQSNQIFCMRVGNDHSKEIIVFANPKNKYENLLGSYIEGNKELLKKVFDKK